MKGLRPAAAALLLLGAACGYRVLDPAVGRGRVLAVPGARNVSRWRGLEAELTGALRQDLQRQLEVRLGSPEEADLVLRTEIRQPFRSAPVRDAAGGASLGSSTLEVHWSLTDAGGTTLREGRVRRSLEFLPAAGENASSAFAELLADMAEQVAMEVAAALAYPNPQAGPSPEGDQK